MLKDIIHSNRSFRRFDESVSIEMDTLRELVDLARHSASGSNKQPLKYMLSCDAEKNALVFETLSWAGAIKEWVGPAEGERPTAYIIVLGDTSISKGFGVDHGIASQSILLGAAEKGIGGCMLGSVKRDTLRESLSIDEQYEILLVLAMGKPGETVELEDLPEDGSIDYYHDENGVHRVPKRSLEDLIIE